MQVHELNRLWRPADVAEGVDDLPITDVAVDEVPTADQDDPRGVYRDWNPSDTQIICYRVGNSVYSGVYAETREAAFRHCTETYGRILEANYVPGRAFFRVRRSKT